MSNVSSSSSNAAVEAAAEAPSTQQIIKVFQDMLENRRNIISKIGEFETQWAEHKRVLDTIKVMDPKRRSFQLINGVLVETTIEEVLPKVEANKDGIYSITQTLQDKLDKLSKEINIYQEKYKITIQRPGMSLSNMPEPVIDGERKSSGVLA